MPSINKIQIVKVIQLLIFQERKIRILSLFEILALNLCANRKAYNKQAVMLAKLFLQNFEKYARQCSYEILIAQPLVD